MGKNDRLFDLAGLFASVDAGASFADVTMNLEKALDDYYLSSISGSRYSPNAPGQRNNLPVGEGA